VVLRVVVFHRTFDRPLRLQAILATYGLPEDCLPSPAMPADSWLEAILPAYGWATLHYNEKGFILVAGRIPWPDGMDKPLTYDAPIDRVEYFLPGCYRNDCY
jgi:hypothetical protein